MNHLSNAVLMHLSIQYGHVWREVEDWKSGGLETINIERYTVHQKVYCLNPRQKRRLMSYINYSS
jgi:hypothetical protein